MSTESGRGPLAVLCAVLLALLVLAAAVSMMLGRGAGGALWDLVALWRSDPETARLILQEVRLPRTLLGVLVGATLGLCGAALQGLLRNPLAEPGILGASSGAALGAVVVFYFGMASAGAWLVPLGGVIGSAVALAVLYLLAGRRPELLTIILAGVAINAFAGAMTSLALNFAPSPYAIMEIIFWMLGSLADRSLLQVQLALPLMLAGGLLIATAARGLDALTLGTDAARSLGFSPTAVQLRVIAGTALAVGAAVAVTGVVGFVGLVVPHLLRPLVGYRPARLLLPSALAGAVLLLAADVLIRSLPPGPELKLGVVTAMLGAPFFLFLILRSRRQTW